VMAERCGKKLELCCPFDECFLECVPIGRRRGRVDVALSFECRLDVLPHQERRGDVGEAAKERQPELAALARLDVRVRHKRSVAR